MGAPDSGVAFVGRGREIDEILGIIAVARDGSGTALQISGESGIGKTALAQRAASIARGSGFRTVWTSSLEDIPVPGYWTWREVAHQLGADASIAVEWPEVSPEGDLSVPHFELFTTIRDLLRQLAAERPLFLVFDDAQWMDSASERLLRFLAKHLSGLPVVLLVTFRSTPGTAGFVDSGWRQIQLAGLSEPDVFELLQRAGASTDDATVSAVLRSSGGNALFVRELSRLRAAGDHLGIPEGLRSLTIRRVKMLEPTVQDALAAASVVGFQFEAAAVANLLNVSVDLASDRLREAERAGIVRLVDAGTALWEFAHDLTREVVYGDLPDSRKRPLHLSLGRWLISAHRGSGAEIARHLRLSGAEDVQQSVLSLEREAAQRAFATSAFAEAGQLFQSAATAARAIGDEAAFAEMTLRAGESRRAAGLGDRGRAEFLEVLPLVDSTDPDLFARCVLGLEPGRMDLGFAFRAPDPEVVQLLRHALALRAGRTDHLTVRLMSHLAAELYFSGERHEALETIERAVAIARADGSNRALAGALATFHDIALVGTPGARESLAVADELVDAAARIDDDEARLAGRLARVLDLLALGRRTEVEAELAAFEREATSSRRAGMEWFPAMWRAMLAIAAGKFEEAENLRQSALQMGFASLGELAIWNASFQQYFLLRELDQLAVLEPTTRAFAVSNPEQPALACGLTYLLAETERLDEAAVELDRLSADSFAAIRDRNWPISWLLLAESSVITGARAHAEELYRQGLPFQELAIFSSIGATWVGTFALELGRLAHFLGLPDAERHLNSALAFARQVGFQPWILEAELALLAWQRSHQAPGDTEASLQNVLRRASDAGLQRIARRARAALESGAVSESPSLSGPAVMQRDGRIWNITWQGKRTSIPDSKGLLDIAMLVSQVNTPIRAVDLMTRDGSPSPRGNGKKDLSQSLERIDREALRQYRDRLRELDEEISEAEGFADLERVDRLRHEKEFLLAEVNRSLNLRGEPRSDGGDQERARKAVEMRISFAINRIASLDEALSQHFSRSIRTGIACAYQPESPVEWHATW
ncbi:MAG: AAA family ATPase [Dehalococcoidia bacterium]